jgi:hypothetical protein
MPRKSAAALSVVSLDAATPRLRPPATLSEAERALFVDLISTNRAEHFQQSDLPLLCRYVEAAVMAERAAAELRENPVINGKASPWLVIQEKNLRAMVSLSMRLRLSPQARNPKTSSARPAQPLSYYERMALSEQHES